MLAVEKNVTQQEMLWILEQSGANIVCEPMVLLSGAKKPISISEAYGLLANSKDQFSDDKKIVKSN